MPRRVQCLSINSDVKSGDAPYSLLRHICWGSLLDHRRDRTWIAAVTDFAVYLDDSGHPDSEPYVIVAGFVASESQWLEFEREWQRLLDRYKIGAAFHMTKFRRQKMTAIKADWILSQLCAAINKHVAARFVGAVDMAAYRRVNDTYALEECIAAPYSLAARHVASELREWQRDFLADGDHLLVFVEEGTKHFGDMEQVFTRDRLPVPIRVPKTLAAVQPADMLGWEALHYLRTGSISKNLKRLLPRVDQFGGIFRESDLQETCRRAKVLLRSDLKPGDTIRFHSNRKRIRQRTIK